MHSNEQSPFFDSELPSSEPIRIEITEPVTEPEFATTVIVERLPSPDDYDAYAGMAGISDQDKAEIERLYEGGQFNRAESERRVLGRRVEGESMQSPARPINHATRHHRRSGRSPAQHPRVRQSPAYDKVITPEMRPQPFPPVDSEAARSARQIVDGGTNDTVNQV